MRYIGLPAILLMFSFGAYSQNTNIDSLKKKLSAQKADSNKVKTLIDLSASYQLASPDSCLVYAQRALTLAEKLRYDKGIFWSEIGIHAALYFKGDYPQELANAFKALSLSKKLSTPETTGYANGMLSDYYYSQGDYNTSLSYWREVIKIGEKRFPDEMLGLWANLSKIYDGMNMHDSAMFYAKKAYGKIKGNQGWHKEDYDVLRQRSLISTALGNAFAGKANYDSAMYYYRRGLPVSKNIHLETNVIDCYNGIAAVYKTTGKLDSAAWYAKKVLTAKIGRSYPVSLLKAANLLSDIYELQNRSDSTLKYLRLAISVRDSLFSREKMTAVQNINYKEQEQKKEMEAAKTKLQNQIILYFLLTGLTALLAIAGILLRDKRLTQLQKMRNNIADDLHDDIGSALSSIGILSELAKARSPEALSLLSSIEESIINIQENMSDIVWAVNPKNDRFENVLQRMNQFASEILDAKNIELSLKSDESLSGLRITMEQRKNFYLFFKEAINNAAKYSVAKKVCVNIVQKDRQVEMTINDNGKGFNVAEISGGNGMGTLKKRAAELCADFKIQSLPQEGTIVKLKFKIA